jgi:hypothetical protein
MRLVLSGLIALSTCVAVHGAELTAVSNAETCFLCNSAPSMTVHWRGRDSKAVLLVIPGGTGQVGLSARGSDLKQPFFENLKILTEPEFTKGQLDVVVLDSPNPLSSAVADLSGRATKEHMVRIESVLKHYKEKTGLPVWILGQSNGGASLANFIGYMLEKKQSEWIAGAIASTTRPESRFPSPLSIPFLFITHKLDGCRNLHQLHRMYEGVKSSNSAATDWVVIEGGEAQAGKDPCRSGFHMFFKAGQAYAQAIDAFIGAHLR